MSAYNEFNKALKYLDFGNLEKGEVCLKRCIELAEAESDYKMLVPAYCCYGDYLVSVGEKKKALEYLKKVEDLKKSLSKYDDKFEYEFARAEQLIIEIVLGD